MIGGGRWGEKARVSRLSRDYFYQHKKSGGRRLFFSLPTIKTSHREEFWARGGVWEPGFFFYMALNILQYISGTLIRKLHLNHSFWLHDLDLEVWPNPYKVQLFLIVRKRQPLNFTLWITGNGGDPNIQDVNKLTPLHRTALVSHDDRLLRLLCENGANVNATDRGGNSPLITLCDILSTDIFDYLEDLSPRSDDTLEDTSATMCVKTEFLTYILSQKDLKVSGYEGTWHIIFTLLLHTALISLILIPFVWT